MWPEWTRTNELKWNDDRTRRFLNVSSGKYYVYSQMKLEKKKTEKKKSKQNQQQVIIYIVSRKSGRLSVSSRNVIYDKRRPPIAQCYTIFFFFFPFFIVFLINFFSFFRFFFYHDQSAENARAAKIRMT